MVVNLYDYLEWMYNSKEEYRDKYESIEEFIQYYLEGTLGIEEGLTHEEFLKDTYGESEFTGTCDYFCEVDKDKRSVNIFVVKGDDECKGLKGLD